MTDRKCLEDKVALVTGSAGGQGRSHVARFLQEGAHVLAIDTREVESECVEERHGDSRLLRANCDVCDSVGLKAVVEMATEQLGPIDTVVANAGISGTREPAWEIDDDEWERVIAVNLSGVWRTIRAVAPSLLGAKSGASIIVIGSTCAVRGYPATAHYTAAKHGLVGLTRVLSAELAPHSVRVNIVHPTLVDTPLIHTQDMYRAFSPLETEPTRETFEQISYGLHQLPIPWVQTQDVTEAVLWLASDKSRYVTGAEIAIDGGAIQRS